MTIEVDGEPEVFHGDDCPLSSYANFLSHVTTAYGIFRHKAAEIGEADFLGRYS